MSDKPGDASHLFIVRVWREALGDGRSEYRSKVQHANSGDVRYFRGEAPLVAFISGMLKYQEGICMSAQDNLQFIQAFLASHDPSAFYAEDATFQDMTQPEPLRGSAAIGGMLRAMYGEVFTEVHSEPRGLVAGETSVVAEFVFHGKNTGSLNGMPPTGRTVAVPMTAIYEIAGGKIHRGRLYYDSLTMARQLGWVQ
jgi:steroid delta-isomerase-like uncharacterized protein